MNVALEKVPYNHPLFPVYIGKGVVGDEMNFFYRRYWHSDIELVCILEGSICYSVNGETIKLTQGQSLFINSNQIHYNFSEDMQYCEFICVNFNPLMLIDKKMAEEFMVPVLKNTSLPYCITENKMVFESICEIYDKRDEQYFQLWFAGIFCKLWARLSQEFDVSTQYIKKPEMESFKKMMKFVRDNYKTKITLKQIAEAGNVCKSGCNEIFNKYTGLTPINYLNEYRLRQSILLMNTDMNIMQICLETGFSGASYFAETFKKKYGITPNKYRSML